MSDEADRHWMQQALRLARQGEGQVEPNPMVGCVLVRSGELIGEGFHQRFGGAHAEVEAIRSCDDARGATAYVTLEPCCHQGKTPPCTAALISAGVAHVVVAMEDPFPQVAGQGLATLRAAGIGVRTGILRQQANALNAPYLKRVATGKPWVIAKWAMTIDGKIATTSGQSQWITGAGSRAEVHRLRARVDAIAVGMGTVEADDPTLNARPIQPGGEQAPIARIATRLVFCQQRTPRLDSRLVNSLDKGPVVVAASAGVDPERLEELQRHGVNIFGADTRDPEELVEQTLQAFGSGKIVGLEKKLATNFMLEGGGKLLASFAQSNQLDECHVYVGPLIFGGERAAGPVGGAGIRNLSDAQRFALVAVDRFDEDVRLCYRRVEPE